MKRYAKISYLDYINAITHDKSIFQYVLPDLHLYFLSLLYTFTYFTWMGSGQYMALCFWSINKSRKDILNYKHSAFIYIYTQQNILYHNLDCHSITTPLLNTFESLCWCLFTLGFTAAIGSGKWGIKQVERKKTSWHFYWWLVDF